MKVLLINHFPLEGSGSGTYTKNIALHLRKRGRDPNAPGDVFKG